MKLLMESWLEHPREPPDMEKLMQDTMQCMALPMLLVMLLQEFAQTETQRMV